MQRSVAVVVAAGLLVGCGGGSDFRPAAISIAVTDAPVDNADAVVVTFTRLELLDGPGNAAQSFTFDTPQAVDLLALQGNNSRFLIRDAVVPVGTYQELRLFVDTENANCNNLVAPFASYIRIDGTDYPLIVPSGGASGFKVKGPLTVAAGATAAYTIDFDLRRSVHARGATACYNLRPVLRVVDNARVGTLAGSVDDALLLAPGCTADPVTGAGAAVYVYGGAGVVPDDVDGSAPEPLTTSLLTPANDGSGDFSYEVGFLLAGDYTAALTCQAGDDDPEGDDAIALGPTADVTITANAVTLHDFDLAASP